MLRHSAACFNRWCLDQVQSVPVEASTCKTRFERKKTPSAEGPHLQCSVSNVRRCCDHLELQKCDRLHNEYEIKYHFVPKLKSQTRLKVCPLKRQLTRSVLREKNSIGWSISWIWFSLL